jgi:hypothetical protein
MFNNQIQRVKDNILPFVYIGLFVGIFIGKASWFRSFSWIDNFLNYIVINTYYPDSGQIIFFSHFEPDTLTFMLAAIFAFAAIIRITLGVREKDPTYNEGIIQSVENLASLLAIAWLGLILGITLPVLVFEGYRECIAFFVFVAYPLLFLVEVSICTAFLSGETLMKVNNLSARYLKMDFGIRLEGLFLLGLAMLVLTFQDKHSDMIYSFTRWVRTIL